MIRIKVVRASHLAIGLAAAALVIAAALIFLNWASQRDASGMQTAAVSAAVSSCHATARNFRYDPLPVSPAAPVPSTGKRILIYHTHTHEAYLPGAADPYTPCGPFRTEDTEHSVVRVGRALADALADMGHSVVHDDTDHELTDMTDAYARSLLTLERYGSGFDLYIDLHRDGETGAAAAVTDENGRSCARVMFLLGSGANFAEKPDLQANLAFARLATGAMNRLLPGSTRPVSVTENRYNQHIGSPALLIEAGSCENTLEEALNIVPVLAAALDEALMRGE